MWLGGGGGSAAVSRERRRGRRARGFVCSAEPPVLGSGPGGVVPCEEGRAPLPPPTLFHIGIVSLAVVCGEGAAPPTQGEVLYRNNAGLGAQGGPPRVPGAQVQAGCPLWLRLHFPGCPCGAAHVRQLLLPPRHRITLAWPEPPGLSLGGRQLHKTLPLIPPVVPPVDGAEPRSRLTSGLGVVASACPVAVPCRGWLGLWGLCRGVEFCRLCLAHGGHQA